MKEPFFEISYNPHPSVKYIEGKRTKIMNFRSSQLNGCFYKEYLKKIKGLKYEISPQLSDIFDLGSDVHEEDELLMEGAKCVIASEEEMKIMHNSRDFTVSGHFDYLLFDFNGRYIKDLKTTKTWGLFYFIKDFIIDKKFPLDNKIQLSTYAYIWYVIKQYYIDHGVIEKIAKDREDRRVRVSLSTKLFTSDYMRNYILEHPVILAHRFPEKYDENYVIGRAIDQMSHEDNLNKGKCWKCGNCQFREIEGEECEVKMIVESDSDPKTKSIEAKA